MAEPVGPLYRRWLRRASLVRSARSARPTIPLAGALTLLFLPQWRAGPARDSRPYRFLVSVTNMKSFRRKCIIKIFVLPSLITTTFTLTHLHILQPHLIYPAPFPRLAFASVSVELGRGLTQAVVRLVSWLAPRF